MNCRGQDSLDANLALVIARNLMLDQELPGLEQDGCVALGIETGQLAQDGHELSDHGGQLLTHDVQHLDHL